MSRAPVAAANPGETSDRAGAADEMEGIGTAREQRLSWMADTMRPNIHIAIRFHHYTAEYARLINCSTLSGEYRHRQVLLARPFCYDDRNCLLTWSYIVQASCVWNQFQQRGKRLVVETQHSDHASFRSSRRISLR